MTKLGLVKRAFPYWSQVRGDDPGCLAAWALEADGHLLRNHPGKAARLLARARASFGSAALLEVASAKASAATGDWADAEQRWRLSMELAVPPAEAWAGLYYFLVQQDKFSEADALFQDVAPGTRPAPAGAPLNLADWELGWWDWSTRQLLRTADPTGLPLERRVRIARALVRLDLPREAGTILALEDGASSGTPEALALGAEMAAACQDWPAAAALLQRAMELRPEASEDGPNAASLAVERALALAELALAGNEPRQSDARAGLDALAQLPREARANTRVRLLQSRLATRLRDWQALAAVWTDILANEEPSDEIATAGLAAGWQMQVLEGTSPPSPGPFFSPAPEVVAANQRLRAQMAQGRGKERFRAEIREEDRRELAPVPSFAVVRDAVILPHLPTREESLSGKPPESLHGGVYDSAGNFIRAGLQLGRARHEPIELFGPIEAFPSIKGRWIYGAGAFWRHIGHFTMDCLGRLWAAERCGDPLDGVIFMTGRRAFDQAGEIDFSRTDQVIQELQVESYRYLRDLIAFFTGKDAFQLVARPVRVEELIVPDQLISLEWNHAVGHPDFRAFVRRRADLTLQDKGGHGRYIYVSRSRLAPDRGLLCGEAQLERELQQQGYDIFYPELLTIPEQMATYRHAERIIFAAGTAVHIAALALDGRQDIALVSRYPQQNARNAFAEQLLAFGARRAVWIESLAGHFAAPELRLRYFETPHALDVQRTLALLHEAGFVDRPHASLPYSFDEDRMEFQAQLARAFPGKNFAFNAIHA